MSVNSSSSSNATSLPYTFSVCLNHGSTVYIFTAFSGTNILLLLPLCVFIIYLGVQRWQKRRTAMSHSDAFAYHMVAIEMIGIFGCGCFCCGVCFGVPWLMMVGAILYSVISNGQILFHTLTCGERYLAVVHPIAYLGLRNRGGVTIRNVSVGCVWLYFFGSFGFTSLANNFTTVPLFCLFALCTAAVTFSSLSVLRVLIRSGPGDGGKDRERVDQSKMRAFHTIVAILAALTFRLSSHVLILLIYTYSAMSMAVRCALLVSGTWFNLPTSLVLPLLFLHRAGKLLGCRNNAEAGQGSQ